MDMDADRMAEVASLKDEFKKYDTDGDGVMSRNELAKLLRAMPGDLTEEDINVVFQAADSNKDGVIQVEEFLDYIFRAGGSVSALESRPARTRVEEGLLEVMKEAGFFEQHATTAKAWCADSTKCPHVTLVELFEDPDAIKALAQCLGLTPKERRKLTVSYAKLHH